MLHRLTPDDSGRWFVELSLLCFPDVIDIISS